MSDRMCVTLEIKERQYLSLNYQQTDGYLSLLWSNLHLITPVDHLQMPVPARMDRVHYVLIEVQVTKFCWLCHKFSLLKIIVGVNEGQLMTYIAHATKKKFLWHSEECGLGVIWVAKLWKGSNEVQELTQAVAANLTQVKLCWP